METLPFYDSINNVYESILKRKVDYDGFCTYTKLFSSKKMTEEKLEMILKASDEYKKLNIKESKPSSLNTVREFTIDWDILGAYKSDSKIKEEFLLSRKLEKQNTSDMFTFVITNWKRLDMVKKCFESILNAGFTNIVISNCGLDKNTLGWLKEVSDKYSFVKIVTTKKDLGVNQLWLQGLYYVTTPYVCIFHDDDEVHPNIKNYRNKINELLSLENLYFMFWDAIILENNKITTEYHSNWDRSEGYYTTDDYLTTYLKATYPLSPVVQIMKTDICIRVLSECKYNFTTEEHFSKPTMMLGNEIMMTLRTLEHKNKAIYYIDKALTLYGRHPMSESEIYVQSKEDTLINGYKCAREYFSNNPYYGPVTKRNFIHVVNIFNPSNEDDHRRHFQAIKNWYQFYEKGIITPRFIYDNEFERNSTHVGDKKSMPFIKDIINISIRYLRDNDVIILTNSDILFANDFIPNVRPYIEKYGCSFGFRYDSYEEIDDINMSSEDIESLLKWYVGSDVFVFTKQWWTRWGSLFPDLLIGKPNWDWIMRVLMGYSVKGEQIWCQDLQSIGNIVNCNACIYHEKHESYAELQDNYFKDNANLWNWNVAKEWFTFMKPDGNIDGFEIFNNVKSLNTNGWNEYIKLMKMNWVSYK